METIQKQGMQVSSLLISRAENAVVLNDMEFKLTEAAIETLSVLAEARLDDDVLTGAQIESVISGRKESDCDEASGAMRIKRLRDALGQSDGVRTACPEHHPSRLHACRQQGRDPDDLRRFAPFFVSARDSVPRTFMAEGQSVLAQTSAIRTRLVNQVHQQTVLARQRISHRINCSRGDASI
jgi:hypothetical protein